MQKIHADSEFLSVDEKFDYSTADITATEIIDHLNDDNTFKNLTNDSVEQVYPLPVKCGYCQKTCSKKEILTYTVQLPAKEKRSTKEISLMKTNQMLPDQKLQE